MSKFQCEAGVKIRHGAKCPECGATERDRCRRAPDWKSKFEALKAKLERVESLPRYRCFADNCRTEDRDGMFVLYDELRQALNDDQ